MRNKTTFLHYLRRLAITAAVFLLPASALAQSYEDLVGNTLEGWTLYWGSYESKSKTYDWTFVNQFGNNTGSGADGVKSSLGAYSPDVDDWKYKVKNPTWPTGGSAVCAPRFYINTSEGASVTYDPLYCTTTMANHNEVDKGCYLPVLPQDKKEPYKNSFRLGSVSYNANGNAYGSEIYGSYQNRNNMQNGFNGARAWDTGGSYASAEGASYDLFVTSENALLTIHYAFVACNPNCTDDHSAEKYNAAAPSFDLKVMPMVDDKFSETTKISCGTATMDPCTITEKVAGCSVYPWGNFARGLVTSKWQKSVYDLSDYKGKWVRILVRTHDCVYMGQSGGGHSGYCYFTARTRPVKLDIKYCKSDEPISVTAPDGFDSYQWFGSLNGGTPTELTTYANKRNINVDNANSLPYDNLKCIMSINGMTCNVVIDTTFKPANLKPNIGVTQKCNYSVTLLDKTFEKPNIPGDTASIRLWYVLDAEKYPQTMSVAQLQALDFKALIAGQDYVNIDPANKSVDYTFKPEGQWVRLYVQNIGGCEASTFVFVKPNPVAKFGKAAVEVCENSPVTLTFTRNNDYNSLAQTEAATEVYRWSQYSNLSNDLKFTVTKEDGTTVSGLTGSPIAVGDAKTDYIHFDYIAKDKWGCPYEGQYDIVVNQKPYLSLTQDLQPDSTDANGNLYFKVCPGTTKVFQAYSSNARKFRWSTEDADQPLADETGGMYYSNTKEYGFGNYFINVIEQSKNACESRIYFNVINYWDSVLVDVPADVCPFEPVAIPARNYQSAPTWWEVRDGETEHINQQSGVAMVINRPSATSTYYCHAFDTHGCDYTKNFKLNLKAVQLNELRFSNLKTGDDITETNANSQSSHLYVLPNFCTSDNLSVTVTNAGIKAKHAYKTNYDPDFVEITGDNRSATQSGFSPRENQELVIIWRTTPIDVFGNDECIVYDTIKVRAYPTILSKAYVNGSDKEYYACDKSQVELEVKPYFYGSTPEDTPADEFTMLWTDDAGGYNLADRNSKTASVLAVIENATATNQGKVYTYTYMVTSKGGCNASFNIPVYISPLPDFDLKAEPEFLCSDGKEFVTATDKAEGQYPTYGNPTVTKWTFPNNGDLGNTTDYIYLTNRQEYTGITTPTDIHVVGTTAKGCTTAHQVTITPAVSPDIKVKLVDVNGTPITKVCAGSQYRLVVTDASYSAYGSIFGCNEDHVVTVKRKSDPIENIMWAEDEKAKEQLTDNALLSRKYNFAGTEFGNYTARNVIENADDYYDIEITSPCGCKTKLANYTVPILPAPVVTIDKDPKKSFLCPNDSIKLVANTTDSSTDKKYYWTVSQAPVAAGDLTGAQAGNDTSKAFWSEDATAFYYNAQIYNGQCYGVNSVLIYNQQAPHFEVNAQPDAMCEQGKTAVTLSVNCDDPTAAYNKYYLRNKSGNYNGVVAWDGTPREIRDISSVLGVDNKVYVRAGVARYVGSDQIISTEASRFCYSEVEAPISITNNPVIEYQIKKTANGAALTEPVYFCPNENYVITVKNTNYVAGVKDIITLTDLDDPTRTFSKTVNPGVAATFADALIVTADDKTLDRWQISITPYNTTCSTVTKVNVGINEVPVIAIDQAGARYLLGENKDTAAYCVNYYSIFGRSGSSEKYDIQYDGVTLTANVMNDNGKAYKYHWTRSTEAGSSTAFYKDKKKNFVTEDDATILGYLSEATTNTSYQHDATYSVYVTDAAGCRSNTASMSVRALDAPRYNSYWENDPVVAKGSAMIYNACVNSETTVKLTEGMYNPRTSTMPIPRYTYHAYYADATDPANNYNQYGGFGTELGEEIAMTKPGITYSDQLGNLKRADGTAVPDSARRITVTSTVKFPIGDQQDYYYVVTKQNDEGCINYLTIHYNPHQGVDPNKMIFKVSVNQGSTTNTPKTEKLKVADLDAEGGDTIAYICPGDYLVFDFWDMTEYFQKYMNSNPWNYNHNYYVNVEFQTPNQNSASTAWGQHNSDTTGTSLQVATNKTISGPQRIRFAFYSNSDRDSRCVSYSPYFWISIANSPKLSAYGDDACRLDNKGNKAGLVRFRAASNAPEGSKHHYTWWTSDGNTQLKDGEDGYHILGEDGDQLTYQTDFSQADMGTATYKDLTVRIRDEVEGYCRSTDLNITRRLYNNPDFTIEPDKEYVCAGDTVHFKVTQNYNVARNCGWQYYTNDSIINTTSSYSMYNDNANRSTGGADAKHTSTTFPHYYISDIPVTKGTQDFYVNAFYNTGSALTFEMKAGVTTNLYCYTVKNYKVHALNTPDPVVRMVAAEDAGLFHKDELIMAVSKAQPDSIGRKVCPETEYYRMFSNNNPDTLDGYKQTATFYYIKDNNQDTDYKILTANYKQTLTEKVNPSLTANDHYFTLYAETENGCSSEPINFQLPLGKVPTVTITKEYNGVCAGNQEDSLKLTANARNNGPFQYEWFVNSIDKMNSLNKQVPGDYQSQWVKPNGTNARYVSDSTTYYVQVSNADGCVADTFAKAYSYALPQFIATLLTETPCKNSAVKVQLEKSPGEINYEDNIFQYQWNTTGYQSIGQSAHDPVITKDVNITDTTILKFRVGVAVNGVYCYDTDSIKVTPNGIPVPTVTLRLAEASGIYKEGATVTSGAKLCPGAKYYMEFRNTAHAANCEPDTFYVTNTRTNATQKFIATNGYYKTDNYTLDENASYRYYMVSGCNCKSSTSLVTLEVSTLPQVSVTGPTQFCKGTTENITLSATVGADNENTKWAWSPSPTADDSLRVQEFMPTTLQTYVVKAINSIGCANTTTHTITPLEVPTLSLNPTAATVCEGGSVTLDVENTNSAVDVRIYNWSGTNGATYTQDQISTVITENTTFEVYAIAENAKACKSETKSVTVTAAKKPSVEVHYFLADDSPFDPATTKLCPGAEFYIVLENKNGNAAICNQDQFEYWEMGSSAEHFVSTVAAGQQANTNGAYKFTMGESSKNYKFKCTSSCNCESEEGTFTIGVAQVPVVSISGLKTYCENTTPTIKLTANSAAEIVDWTWSNNIATDNVETLRKNQVVDVQPNAASTTYTVVGISKDGCTSNTASHTITSLEVPTIDFTAPAYVCMGAEANVKANISLPTGVGVANTVWTPTEATRVADDEVRMNITEPTYFQVKVTTDNNCTVTSDQFAVRNYESPAGVVTIKNLKTNDVIADGGAICAGTSFYPVFQNTVSGEGDAYCSQDTVFLTCITTGETFVMNGLNTTLINNGTDKTSFVMDNQDMAFRYMIRTSCGCYSAKGTFSVRLAAAPNVRITASSETFCADSDEEITLTASAGAETNMTWKWTSCPTDNRTQAVQRFTPSSTGTFIVTGTSASGCSATSSITITRLEKPSLELASYDDDKNAKSVFCNGERVTLVATNTNENNAPLSSVTWSSDLDHNLTGVETNYYSTATAVFTATGTSTNGCSATSPAITVKTAEVPQPTVALYRADGTPISMADARLCPGDKYYAEFTNTNADANCATDNFVVTNANDATETYTVSSTSGFPARPGGSNFLFKMGNAAQVYNYSVTTSCGCVSGNTSFMVNVAPIPTVTISGVDTYCNNDPADIKLTANTSASVKSYEWNTLVPVEQRGDKQVTITPNGTQTFSVVVTSTDGCASEAALHTITAKSAPVVSLTAKDEVCAGSQTGVKANIVLPDGVGISTTQWSPVTDVTRIADDSVNVTVSNVMNIQLTVNATNQCSATSDVLTISPIAHPSVSYELRYYDGINKGQPFDPATTPLCLGTRYYPVFMNNSVTSCAADTFILKGENVEKMVAAKGNEANANAGVFFTVDAAATYFYSAVSSCGCESDELGSYSIKLAADPVLSITASGDGLKKGNSFCEGDQTPITIKVNSSYKGTTTYQWDAPVPAADQKNASFTVVPSASTFSVTGTTDQGCTGTAEFTLSELPKPEVSIDAPLAVCYKGAASLEAKGNNVVRYMWSNGKSESKITLDKLTEPATVSVVGYNSIGCESDPAEWTVGITELPNIDFSYSGIDDAPYVCNGDRISITAISTNGNAKFTWYTDATYETELTVDDIVTVINQNTITVIPNDKVSYKLFVKAVQDGCVNTDNTQVKAYPLPTFELGGKTTYCEGQDLELAIKHPVNNTNYYWDGAATASNSYAIKSVTTAQKPVTVVAVDEHNCQTTTTQPITVNTAPQISIDPSPTAVCPNESARLMASGADTYWWYEKDKNTTVLGYSADFTTPLLDKQTIYRVVGRNSNTLCYDSAFVTVTVKKSPSMTIKTTLYNDSVSVCEGAEKTLQVYGADTFEWSTGVVSSDGPTAVVKPTYDTHYTVTGFIDGCSSSIDIPVRVVNKPEVELVASADGVCRNESVTLKAVVNSSEEYAEGMTYTWNVATNDDQTVKVTKTLTDDFKFTLTVSQGAGSSKCESTVSKLVEAYSLPNVEVVADYDRVCWGGLVNLSGNITNGTPDYTYEWTRSSKPAAAYPSASINPQVSQSTETFTLNVIDLNGCKGVGYKTIQAQDSLVIENIAPTTYCEGAERDSVRLNMKGATEYRYMSDTKWTGNNDTTFFFATPNTYPIDVVGRMPLKGSADRYCESEVMTYKTQIVAAPKVEMYAKDLQGDGVCSGTPVTLHVNSSVAADKCTFDWVGDKTGNHTNEYTEDALVEAREFICKVTDNASQCSGTAKIFVDVYETPTLALGWVKNPVCEGTTGLMEATASSNSTTDFTYIWTRATDKEYKVTTSKIEPVMTVTDTFTVVASDAIHHCVSTPVSVPVQIQSLPTVINTAKTRYCSTDSVRLMLSGASIYFVNNVQLSKSDTAMLLPAGTSHYAIYGKVKRGTSVEGYCTSPTIYVDDTVHFGPTVNLLGNETVCQGTPLDLTADVTNYKDISGLTFNWSEDQNEKSNKLNTYISSNRVITVRVTDPATGCSGIDEKQYSVWENPKAYIEIPDGDMVCNGELANLQSYVTPASDAYSYKWTRKSNPAYIETIAEITPTIAKQDTFFLNVTDLHGCKSNEVSQVIKMVDKPEIKVLGAENPLCQDSMLRLTLSGADVYFINNEQLPANVYTEKMTSARTTYYSVLGYINLPNGAQCYNNEFQVPVTVNDNPTLAISGNQAICEGSALELTVSGADEYEWNTGATGNKLQLTPSGSVSGIYNYSVTGKYTNGCKTVKDITVSTLKSPSFAIKPSAAGVCMDEQVSLEVIPDAGATNTDKWIYLWEGGRLTGATSNPVTTLVSGGNQFTATVTNEAGCSGQETVTIHQYDIPALVIYASTDSDAYKNQKLVVADEALTLCENSQLKLFAQPATGSTGITSYEWDAANDGQIYYPTDNVPNKLTYQHTVIGTTANGCQASAKVNVEIVKAPTVAIRANMAACYDEDIDLYGLGATNYVWPDFNNATGDHFTTPATTIGVNTFTLYGYNAQGCRGEATFDVEVYENPQFSIDADNAYVCQGNKAFIQVVPDNSSADYSYTWSNGTNAQSISPSQRSAGTYDYTVTVTDVNTGCTLKNTVPVTFFEKPKLSLADGYSSTVCRGSDLVLVAQGGNEYYWTVGTEQKGPFYNDETFTSSPTVSINYVLQGINNYENPITGDLIPCDATMTFPVTVVDAPSIQILGSSTICYGDSVKLTATGIDLDATGAKEPYYYWENNNSYGADFKDKFTADNGAEVVYTVKGQSANGCTAIKTKTVTMRPKSVITVSAPSPVCEGAIAYAKASGDNIVSYRWNTSEVADSIAHVITDDVKYIVTATDENECKVKDSVLITMQKKLVIVDETKADKVDGIYAVCSGSNIALKVSGAQSYMWNKNPNKTNATVILAPINDTIYTVEGEYGVCKASLSIPVHAIAAPAVQIEGDGAVCMGDSIYLSPYSDTDNLTYTWNAASEFEVNDATNVLKLKPIVDTKVSLTGRSAEGCASTASTTIKVNNIPELKIDGDLEPCENSYTDLTASGAMSYMWTVRRNGVDYTYNSVSCSPLVPYTISVKLWGIDANNCHSEISTIIRPTKRPEFTVEGDTNICLNSALQLTAINDETACTYKWNNEEEGNIYSAIMTKAGTIKLPVTATLAGKEGCTTTKRVTVVVNELPQLYITGNDYPCENSTMTVAAHGAEKFIWSNNPGDTLYAADGACEYSRDVNTPAPFSAQLSGWKNGCRKDSVFTFQVHRSPLVAINGEDEACKDGVVTLTATSADATTFDWGTDGAGATITPVITETKTFKVSVIDKFGCVGSDEYTVNLISSPTLTVYASEDYNSPVEIPEDGNVKVCSGNALTFTARGAKTWSWVDALESSDSASFTPAGTTTSQRIQLTGYLGSCEASRLITLTILQKPDPWIDGSMNVCEGDTVNLVAMGADHYEWSGVSGVSGEKKDTLNYQLVYQPVEGNVKAIAENGCYTNVPFTLTYTKAPELHVASDYDVCVGAPMEMTVVEPDSNLVYVWNDNFSGESFTYRSTTPGTASVKVEAKVRGIGGCTTVQNYEITTHDLPYITFSADGDNVTVNADSTISLCAGSDLILVPLGAKHYTWTAEGLDTTVNTMVLKPTSNSVYSIKGADEYGCANTRDIIVKTNASPVLYSTTYGVPDANGRINVSVCRDEEIDLDVAGADSYAWFNGSVSKNVTVKPSYSRTYSVSGLKSSTNCPASIEYFVTVNELPDVTITDNEGNTNRVSICRDSKITLHAGGASSYYWTDATDNVISRKDSIVDYAGESDYYIVTGTDSNKCVNTAKFTVKAIEVPTISYEPLDPQVCSGKRTTLYGRSSDANSWYWMLDNDTVSTKSSLTITPTADANYTLFGRNKYGCETSVDVPLTVFSSPTIWVDGYATTNGISDTISVCKYQSLKLTMMGDAESYEWPSGSTDRTLAIESASMSQNYQVTGYGQNNCATTITIPVKVIPTALISIKGDQYVCYGSSTVLTAVADAADYDNYVWSNNMIGNENEVYVFNDTTISVTGYNSTTGCSNTVKFPIIKKNLPVLGYQGNTTICKGASSVIYATGANSYVWQDGSTGDAYVGTPTSNDIYKVVGTLDGCSDSISIPIEVKVAPVIWADGLKPICQGDALNLTAMGAETYEWSDGTTTANFTALPLEDITYTLTGTADNGCSTTIQVPVTVRRRPVVSTAGPTNVCLNSTTDLTAVIESESTNPDGSGNKYRWYHNDEVISTQGILNYLITDAKTTFKLEGIDPAGCANTTNITVTSMALPELSYTGPAEICTGSAGTFYATGAKDYQWINEGDTILGNVFKAKPESDTYYKLIGISAMGCKKDTSILLVVNQLPEVTVAGNTSVCRGEALDLTGAGAVTYLWSNGTTDEHFTATPVATSEYSLTGTDANGCSSIAKFKVTVNELPKFQALAYHENVCQGSVDTLYAVNDDKEGAYTYFWTTADGSNLSGDTVAPIISWKDRIEFTVTANNDSTHCQSSVKKTIYSNPIPVVGFLPYDSVCAHGSLTVTAYGADSYEWKNNGEVIGNKADLTLKDLTTSTQLYVTGQLSGCTSTAVASVVVVPNPIATISEPDGKDYFCNGASLKLVGSGLGEEGVYEWKANGEPFQTDTALYSVINDTPVRSTVYSLTVTNNYGCTNTATKTMNIQSLPQVGILANKTYVCPDQVDSVQFEAVNNTYNREVSWTWESVPGQSDILSNMVNEKFTAIIDTTVSVTLYGTDSLGCVGSSTIAINLRPRQEFQFRVNPACIDNDSRTVNFVGDKPESDNTKWTWTVDMNEDSKNDTKLEGKRVSYIYPGVLADSILVGVHAVDPYGCYYDSTAYIYKWHDFWAPDAFSPNGDGLNDRFVFRGGRFISDFHVVIYDRLGGIVYEGDDDDLLRNNSDKLPTDKGWDGTCKGKACPWGVYGYTVTYNSKQNSVSKSGKKRGTITLIR